MTFSFSDFDIISDFQVVANGGVEESQLYYTTPQANNQAENAGNAREEAIFPADFLPGACRDESSGRPVAGVPR